MIDGKVLVTGADGFIGSHLVEALVRRGYSVRAFVFYNSLNSWGWLDHVSPEVAKNIEVVAGDIRDPHAVREAVQGCRAVYHLAALIAIPYSYRSPDSYIDTNVKGTLNVVQATRAEGVDRVVHTSTSEVYGSAQSVPITEAHPLQAQSPYAASKIGADQIALSMHRSFEVPVTILRPFNTYGPRQSARAVIPAIAIQIAAGEDRIRLGNLHPTRDFTYVEDTARGFIEVAECAAAIGEVINIGSGFEISIGDTVRLIAEIMGRDIEIVTDTERLRPQKSEVERLFAGTQKAIDLFGWAPEYGGAEGFREGLAATIQWFLDPTHQGFYKLDRYSI